MKDLLLLEKRTCKNLYYLFYTRTRHPTFLYSAPHFRREAAPDGAVTRQIPAKGPPGAGLMGPGADPDGGFCTQNPTFALPAFWERGGLPPAPAEGLANSG